MLKLESFGNARPLLLEHAKMTNKATRIVDAKIAILNSIRLTES